MAFGLKRKELRLWKQQVEGGQIAFLTHYWLDPRFPECKTVTKVGCANINKLIEWGNQYNLDANWIHRDPRFPHYDLLGQTQKNILLAEEQWEQIRRFKL